MVYATRGLVGALVAIAADRDPEPVTIALAATPAGDLGVDLPAETPVLTDFYLPETGRSVSAVFGVDLGTPRAQGRFFSHPDGFLGVSRTDDLHEVILVGVPPWDVTDVAAFDRRGEGRELSLLDVEPPEGELPLDPTA